jgi:hypothetical protein
MPKTYDPSNILTHVGNSPEAPAGPSEVFIEAPGTSDVEKDAFYIGAKIGRSTAEVLAARVVYLEQQLEAARKESQRLHGINTRTGAVATATELFAAEQRAEQVEAQLARSEELRASTEALLENARKEKDLAEKRFLAMANVVAACQVALQQSTQDVIADAELQSSVACAWAFEVGRALRQASDWDWGSQGAASLVDAYLNEARQGGPDEAIPGDSMEEGIPSGV